MALYQDVRRDICAKASTDATDQRLDATNLLGHGDRWTIKIDIKHKKAKRVHVIYAEMLSRCKFQKL